MSRVVIAVSGPRIDLHGHAGRCFLAGLPAGHTVVASMGASSVAGAVRDARAGGMTALVLATVSDFAVLRPDPVTGLRARRDFRPGEAYADHRRQLDGLRRAVAAAGAEVVTSAAEVGRAARGGRAAVLLACEGGGFLEGDRGGWEQARAAGVTVLALARYRASEIGDVQTAPPVHGGLSRLGRGVVAECGRLGIVVDCAHASFATAMDVLEASSRPVIISHGQLGRAGAAHPRLLTAAHVTAVASAGGLIGAWPAGLTSQSLAGFADEIIRLTEVAGPGRVAIGTDLDGNYRPVLTSYAQFEDLAGLLRDGGLPQDRIRQILGGNIAGLLRRVIP
jgi:membrane dipeptidase